MELTDHDLFYLRSIHTCLTMLMQEIGGPSIQSEAVADNRDWLDCFIEKHERAVKEAANA